MYLLGDPASQKSNYGRSGGLGRERCLTLIRRRSMIFPGKAPKKPLGFSVPRPFSAERGSLSARRDRRDLACWGLLSSRLPPPRGGCQGRSLRQEVMANESGVCDRGAASLD
jgi:hypothetical protein